jgi:soluble lytic murein transglycosylase-like protein
MSRLMLGAGALLIALPLAVPAPTDARRARTSAARTWEAGWSNTPYSTRSHLRRIAQCESGGNEHAVSSNGRYRGLLQFDYQTWAGVGGHGDPADAPRMEQWYRGTRLYRQRGPSPWPVCGRR